MIDSLRGFCIARWITDACYRGQIHSVRRRFIRASVGRRLGDHIWRFEAVDPDHLDHSSHSRFVCTECDCGECLEALGMYGLIKTQSQSSAIGRKSKTLLKGECRKLGNIIC